MTKAVELLRKDFYRKWYVLLLMLCKQAERQIISVALAAEEKYKDCYKKSISPKREETMENF